MNLLKNTRILTALTSLGLFAIAAISPLAIAQAYGNNTQWQVGFSGNCANPIYCSVFGFPSGFTGGFWGWCAFGGSNGASTVGTVGTQGDCQFSVYVTPPGTHATNPFHISQDITSWNIGLGTKFGNPSVPSFFAPSGTVEFTGPGSFFPTGVPIDVSLVCPALGFVCDTGIPAVAGHTSFHLAPGVALNIQVTHIG